MNQSDFFRMLNAPLVSVRRSWGAVRKADGVLFLKVWENEARRHDGRLIVQITKNKRYCDAPSNQGNLERLEHVGLIRQGAQCFLVMHEVVDAAARPRVVNKFNSAEVFPAGEVVELDGETWVELLRRVPVKDAML